MNEHPIIIEDAQLESSLQAICSLLQVNRKEEAMNENTQSSNVESAPVQYDPNQVIIVLDEQKLPMPVRICSQASRPDGSIDYEFVLPSDIYNDNRTVLKPEHKAMTLTEYRDSVKAQADELRQAKREVAQMEAKIVAAKREVEIQRIHEAISAPTTMSPGTLIDNVFDILLEVFDEDDLKDQVNERGWGVDEDTLVDSIEGALNDNVPSVDDLWEAIYDRGYRGLQDGLEFDTREVAREAVRSVL